MLINDDICHKYTQSDMQSLIPWPKKEESAVTGTGLSRIRFETGKHGISN